LAASGYSVADFEKLRRPIDKEFDPLELQHKFYRFLIIFIF